MQCEGVRVKSTNMYLDCFLISAPAILSESGDERAALKCVLRIIWQNLVLHGIRAVPDLTLACLHSRPIDLHRRCPPCRRHRPLIPQQWCHLLCLRHRLFRPTSPGFRPRPHNPASSCRRLHQALCPVSLLTTLEHTPHRLS
jgi:hypothetical protein